MLARLACAWEEMQQLELVLDNIQLQDLILYTLWEHWITLFGCWKNTQLMLNNIKSFKIFITIYPVPSWSTNISWYGNCRCRSFFMSSIHLRSPGWSHSLKYRFFFWSNNLFALVKYNQALGLIDWGIPFLHLFCT